MVELRFAAVLMLVSLHAQAFANGSSGVGTASIPIIDGITASNLQGKVKTDGNKIVETSTNTPLLSVTDISQSDFAAAQATNQLVSAQLGDVKSFEYTPEYGDHLSSNYWIVCAEVPSKCKKLMPLTKSALVSDLIGTLNRK